MESRTITVIDTRRNGVVNFQSTAETMAEMLDDFRTNGIDATDMAIQEGLTRTELDATSLLPKDVPYRGTTTNNLVFRLTQKEKKIKSGATRRQEVYKAINELGVAENIKILFGRNYTQVTTDELESYLNSLKDDGNDEYYDDKEGIPMVKCSVYHILHDLIKTLEKYGFLPKGDVARLLEEFDDAPTVKGEYSKSELDEMFSGM